MIDVSATATKITTARKEKGFTQEELAARLGVSSQAVSKWERALSLPDIDILLDVSKLLEIPIDYLLNKGILEVNAGKKTIYDIAKSDIVREHQNDLIRVNFGVGLIPMYSPEFVKRLTRLRHCFLIERGVLLPAIRLTDDITIDANQCTIEILGNVVYTHVFQDQSEFCEESLIALVSESIHANLCKFVNRHMVKLLIENLRNDLPFCVDGVIPERFSLSYLKRILRELVERQVSIRDLCTVIETIDDNVDDKLDFNTMINKIAAQLQ